MAGIIGLRAEDMEQVDALKRARMEWPHGAPMVRPSVKAPILLHRDGELVAASARFGFSRRFTSINARREKLLESPMWRRYFGKEHALVPISYVIEWLERDGARQPYLIGQADGSLTFAPALLGHHYEEKEDLAFAICTVPPNGFFSRFHDRMVAHVPRGNWEDWLRPSGRAPEEILGLVKAPGDESMQAVPASPDITKRKAGNWDDLATTGKPLLWDDVKPWPPAKGKEDP